MDLSTRVRTMIDEMYRIPKYWFEAGNTNLLKITLLPGWSAMLANRAYDRMRESEYVRFEDKVDLFSEVVIPLYLMEGMKLVYYCTLASYILEKLGGA